MTIRTRFAPSPTGYLHIGGVRTALFNWLLAKRHGGEFILRIDDTDTDRNVAEALQPILDGFRWLGINWDEGPEVGGPYGPYFQSQRADSYRAAALKLIETGNAYPDYLTKDEVEADRYAQALRDLKARIPTPTEKDLADLKKALAEGKTRYIHRGPHRDTPPAENLKLFQEKPTTLRFKVLEGKTAVVDDLICGKVEQKTDLMGDPVILRANGSALYNFASVVDDVALQITHIVRAREHLANTYTQVLFFEALGYPMPKFAHVPVVNEPNSKKKLSKRDMKKFVTAEVRASLNAIGWSDADIDARDDLNPATVAFYRELGYLPAGLVNYLGRLGWSLDDKSEFIPIDQMIANFSLERVTDSPASFDPKKLFWLAGEYMVKLPVAEKVEGCLPYLTKAKLLSEPVDAASREKITKIVEACGDRIKLFSDILVYAAPFLKADPTYDAKALEKVAKKANVADLLKSFSERLQAAGTFEASSLEQVAHDFCTERGIKFGDLQLPVRVAVTGVEKGFGLFETLAMLGQEEVVRRIGLALQKL
jgi:nondiscriminating glutamyl-tRNA synthetase